MSHILCGDKLQIEFCKRLSKKISCPLIYPKFNRFPDGEIRVEFGKNVTANSAVVVKFFTSNVNSEIIELFFTLQALKKHKLTGVVLILPYFPYTRSHHGKNIYSGTELEAFLSTLKMLGVSRIVTLEPHVEIESKTSIPVKVYSFVEFIEPELEKIYKKESRGISFVSPDKGGSKLVEACLESFPDAEKVIITKSRHHKTGHVKSKKVTGKVQKVCIVIDDIISSGETIKNTVSVLRASGAEKIHVFAAHGVFSQNAPQIMADLKLENVTVTDSVPIFTEKRFKSLQIKPLSPLFSSDL